MPGDPARFPVGSSVTLRELDRDPYPRLAELRAHEPISWVPALNGWLVSRRDLVVAMMRDATTFTVDDPRFSTGRVVGASMLSLDGAEHHRHRDPFADAFRLPEVRRGLADAVTARATDLVTDLMPRGEAELRRDLAAPLAVSVMSEVLGLVGVDPPDLLRWYDAIVDAVSRISVGLTVADIRPPAMAELAEAVRRSIDAGESLLSAAAQELTIDEVVSNAAVLLFGGIETSEGLTATTFVHLLTTPGSWDAVGCDPTLVPNAVEESLRLDPPVVQVDRYATGDVELEGVEISKGDFVVLSIAGANRDPAVFENPDRFDFGRPNARLHVAFAHGPHACVGMHLARMETAAAVEAVVGRIGTVELVDHSPARGLVFRKPRSVDIRW